MADDSSTQQAPLSMEVQPPPEEPGAPLAAGFSRLLRSSKAIVVVAAIVAVVLLVRVGEITSELAVETIKWLVIAFLGAVAVEDGAEKLKRSGGTSPTRAAWLMQQLVPLIGSLLEATKNRPPAAPPGAQVAEQVLRDLDARFQQDQAAAAAAANDGAAQPPSAPSAPNAGSKKE